MILLNLEEMATDSDVSSVQQLVQQAIDLEFATLPPYLYATFSIPDGMNKVASGLFHSVQGEEMVHMCLACNIMNAIGGDVQINPPSFPGHLPGDVAKELTVHLYPFSKAAAKQGMDIETPVKPVIAPERMALMSMKTTDQLVTIGEYYEYLKEQLSALPDDAWHDNRNQITDSQYMQGLIFSISSYEKAAKAIDIIVSEGEGAPEIGSPLDYQNVLSHYYRFQEIYKNRVWTKADNEVGYVWGDPLGVDWSGVYDAISDPETHDFSTESAEAQTAQQACNLAFTHMVDELQSAFRGDTGDLGNAIQSMLKLQMAATAALKVPLNNGQVSGPAFKYDATLLEAQP